MPQAVDEAGNIWEVDAQGNPVRFVGKMGGQQGMVVGRPDPNKAIKDAAALAGTSLNNTGQALDNQVTQATLNDAIRKAKADADKAQIDARKAAAPTQQEMDQQNRMARLNSLVGQINRVQELYNTGPGKTKGFAGVQDYFPTDINARFDQSGDSLAQQGLAAFRVPGQGTVSDRDAIMFDRANLPQASTRDARIEEMLASIRARVESEFQAVGQQAPNWTGVQAEQRRNDPVVGLTGPGNSSVPPGPIAGGDGGGSTQFGLSTGESYTTPQDMAVAAAVNQAFRAGGSVEDLANAARQAGGQITPADIANFQAAVKARAPNQVIEFTPQATGRRSPLEVSLGKAAMSPMGSAALGSADAGLFGLTDEIKAGIDAAVLGKDYTTSRDQADLFKRGAMDINPNAAMVGSIAGGVLGGAGLEGLAAKGLSRVGRGGIQGVGGAIADGAAYGGAYGAGSQNDNRLMGAVKGTVAGGVGGGAGYGATKLVGGTIGGVSDAAVRALSDRGISLSPGQILRNSGPLGSMVNKLESAAESVPLLGSVIKQSRENSFRDFNRAAFDEALAPIGETVGNIAEGGVGDAFDATGRGYGKALNGVNIPADTQFASEIGNAVNMGRGAGGNYGADFNQILSDQIMPLVSGKTALGGQELQDLLRIAGGYSRQYGKLAETGANGIPQPMARPVAGAFDNIQQSIEGLANRQAPDVMPAYNAAKQSYRNVKVLQDAVDAAKAGTQAGEGGVFTPSQLMGAASRNSRKFGGTQGTTRQPFFDLSRAGQDVLPSTLPNSGTADRLMSGAVMGLPALAAGGAASTGVIDPSTAAWIAGISALYTKGGQKLVQKALVGRPEAMRKAGSAISKRARKAGLFGAATVPALLANPSN